MSNTSSILLDLTLEDLLKHHTEQAEEISRIFNAATVMAELNGRTYNDSSNYKNKIIFHISAMEMLKKKIEKGK